MTVRPIQIIHVSKKQSALINSLSHLMKEAAHLFVALKTLILPLQIVQMLMMVSIVLISLLWLPNSFLVLMVYFLSISMLQQKIATHSDQSRFEKMSYI